ncbi:MAG: hypothetical protein V1901_04170 [Patescibacteria group bacterium]
MIKMQYKSNCCNAEVKISTPIDDFFGKKKQLLGTFYYICKKCNLACDIRIKERKIWNRNPGTQILKDKRQKIKTKEIIKETERA